MILIKYIWILPIFIIILFISLTNINPIVSDSEGYYDAMNKLPLPHAQRPYGYPLFLLITGDFVIWAQSILWVITALLIYRITGMMGMMLYVATIGLLFLSQKVLAETLFVFVITLALVSNKNIAFLWICIAAFIKPVMLFFIPVMLLSGVNYKYIIAGVTLVIVQVVLTKVYCGNFISTVGKYNIDRLEGILPYLHDVLINSIGKTVGITGLFWQRVTQLETLSCTLIGLCGVFYFRKQLIFLLPVYVFILSGIAPNQGDRHHIAMAPVCIAIFYRLIMSYKQQCPAHNV